MTVEMAQQLRTFAASTEDPSPIPSKHGMAHNHDLQLQGIQGPLWTSWLLSITHQHTTHTCTYTYPTSSAMSIILKPYIYVMPPTCLLPTLTMVSVPSPGAFDLDSRTL